MSASTKRIFLWTTGRSVSTAFEFSIRTLPNAKVFHDGYVLPYYSANPFKNMETKVEGYTYEGVSAMLQDNYSGKDIIFVKDMAQHVKGKFDMFTTKGFSDFVHSFLIRDPMKTIVSLYRGSLSMDECLEHCSLVGYDVLLDLYKFIKDNNICADPVVIDADDFLRNPKGVMEAYCKAVGIEYREGMTKWEPGSMKTQEFIEQKGGLFDLKWNAAAIDSSGVSQSVAHDVTADGVKNFPKEVLECIEENRPLYHELYQKRLDLSRKN